MRVFTAAWHSRGISTNRVSRTGSNTGIGDDWEVLRVQKPQKGRRRLRHGEARGFAPKQTEIEEKPWDCAAPFVDGERTVTVLGVNASRCRQGALEERVERAARIHHEKTRKQHMGRNQCFLQGSHQNLQRSPNTKAKSARATGPSR